MARLLNEAGYRTRNGSAFTDTTVDRLLRDPTAKGMRRANYTRSTGEKKKWILKIAAYLAEADATLAGKNELLLSLESEDGKLRTEREKLYRLYQADQLSPESFGERDRPLEARLRQIETERPRLQGEIDFMKIQHLSSAEIVSEARDLYSRWGDLAFEEKRRIVETIVDRIVVGKGEINFDLCYLPEETRSGSGCPSTTELPGGGFGPEKFALRIVNGFLQSLGRSGGRSLRRFSTRAARLSCERPRRKDQPHCALARTAKGVGLVETRSLRDAGKFRSAGYPKRSLAEVIQMCCA